MKNERGEFVNRTPDGIEWELCEAHRSGAIMDYGVLDVECLGSLVLPDSKKTVVLVRVDEEGDGTYFRVERQRWMPLNVRPNDPRLWIHTMGGNVYIIKYRYLDNQFEQWGSKWDLDRTNPEWLKEQFEPLMRESLNKRGLGLRAPESAKTKVGIGR